MMIMEAMRLSLLDHEEHQRKSAADTQNKAAPQAQQGTAQPTQEQARRGSTNQPPAGMQTPTSPVGATPSSSRRSSNAAGTMASWRASSTDGNGHNGHNGHGGGRAQAAASKLLSKITVNRSRANSKSSVHFAASPTTMGAGSSSGSGPGPSSSARARSASASTPSTIPSEHHPSPLGPPLGSASLGPASRRSLDVTATRQQQPLVSDRDSITEFAAGPSRPTPERSTSDLIDMGSLGSGTDLAPAAGTPPDVDEPSTPRMAPQASGTGVGGGMIGEGGPGAQTPTAAVEQEPLDISPSRHSVAESFDSRSSFAASYTDPVPRAARSKPLAAMADDD